MKKILLTLILGVGLIALSACSAPWQKNYNDNNPATSGLVPSERMETEPEAPASSVLNDGIYSFNVAESKVAWLGTSVHTDHTGTIALKSGSLTVEAGLPINGEVIIAMDTISSDEGLGGLVTHLKNDDFFDTANYPEAKLTITSIASIPGADLYSVTGDLTIKDVTAPVEFMAQISSVDGGLSINAAFSIDRTKWNIKYGSGQFFKDLGDKAIEDEISFNATLKASL